MTRLTTKSSFHFPMNPRHLLKNFTKFWSFVKYIFCCFFFFRKIAKGEEITVNYIGLINNIHRDQRRKCLFESHQFDCFCTGCNLSEENLTVCWELIQWKVRGQWKKTKDLFQKNQTTTVVTLLLQYTVVVWCFMNKSLEQPMAMKSAVLWVDAQHCKKISNFAGFTNWLIFLIQYIFDLRKSLGTEKIFLKSNIIQSFSFILGKWNSCLNQKLP